MNKKVLVGFLIVIVLAGVAGGFFIFSRGQKIPSPLPQESNRETQQAILPSATLKQYSDPAGFTISYPDDLNLSVNENIDANTYAHITLASNKADGSIAFRAVDTKFTSLADWLASTNATSNKETKLGVLTALEVRKEDGLLTSAVDSGILFTLEAVFAGKEQFWSNVYNNILSSFSFNSTQETEGKSQNIDSSSEVVFEGEEIIE
ncbi:hypothetical protein HYT17_02905 [Candidatus Microgenomates bacterium]|nr:hypothetical protein [Candidatus Microgenomates bacterium]